MPISKQELAQIIANKSAALCSAAGDRMIDQHSSRGGGNSRGYNPDPASFDDGNDDPWAMPGNYSPSEYMQRMNSINEHSYSKASAMASRMPDAIKNSMIDQPIDTSAFNPNASVLDQMGLNSMVQAVNEQRGRQVHTQATQQMQPAYGGVDYGIIKNLVRECLEESRVLNENKLSQIHISKGKIQIIDAQGRIFEAKLELVGNINDEKK